MAWFESFLRDRGIAGDPPPKKKGTLLSPLTELNDRLAKLPFFQKAAEEARSFAHEAVEHPWTTYMGMVGPGELGSLAERKVAQAALRFHVPGEAEPRQFTGPSHAHARMDAEDALGDLLDENFEPRFKEESGFVDNLGNWLDRKEATALAKKNNQIGGSPRAVEAVKRSGELKSEVLRQPEAYAPSQELQGLLGKEHNPEVLRIVEPMVRNNPMPRVTAIDAAKAQKMAKVYEGLPKNDPAAKSAYDALNREVESQYKAIKKAGYKLEFVDKDPYANSAEMMKDVRENKRLQVYKTASDQQHPYMTPKQNDMFRAVHDWIAHAGPGNQFGPIGEENAYRMHAATLSPEAQRALATETRGQNSWVNFGPNAHLPVKERPFAEQKAALFPQEYLGDYGEMPEDKAFAVDMSPPPEAAAPRFNPSELIPAQRSLKYYVGLRTPQAKLDEARERAFKAFRAKGPYGKLVAKGEKVKGAPAWYDTRDALQQAEAAAPGSGADQMNEIFNMMAASTARSEPKSNLKRGIMWSVLNRYGLLDPEQLRSNELFQVPPKFGHFAQRKMHQKGVADVVEFGGLNPLTNPKPSSFGGAGPHGVGNLGLNWYNPTLDDVMSKIAVGIDPKMQQFFTGSPETAMAPRNQFYAPIAEGFHDAAHEAYKQGRVPLPHPDLDPTAAFQAMGWMGKSPSASKGSLSDIFNLLRDESADMWGVSPEQATSLLFNDQRPFLLPLDYPLGRR